MEGSSMGAGEQMTNQKTDRLSADLKGHCNGHALILSVECFEQIDFSATPILMQLSKQLKY